MVCDGVVGGGGDDDVVGEVDVEESGGFVEFFWCIRCREVLVQLIRPRCCLRE